MTVAANRRDLVTVQSQVSTQRTERNRELNRYSSLERERQRALSTTRRGEQRTAARITELEADAERLDETIAALVRARGSAVARLPAATLGEDDIGRLAWPVDGELVYRFGEQPFRDRTTITRDGIGIRVAVGTPVKAVRAGIVAQVGPFGTFGQVVILDHGAGYWTLYTHLSEVRAFEGTLIDEGDTVGLSGGANTEEGPHLGFQIRQVLPNSIRSVPLDPVNWLRRR